MQAKDEGDEGARPSVSGDLKEECEEQESGDGVDGDARQVMASALKSVEFHVQHVGEPGQGQPVRIFGGLEGPVDPGSGQAATDVEIFGYIVRIVVIDELEAIN